LAFAQRHLAENGIALFPKGSTWQNEVAEARRQWQFELETVTSETAPNAAILIVKGVSRV
jgi:16S rRNA (guanine527-N7)-methyltransferase